jgi:hypothetical protein
MSYPGGKSGSGVYQKIINQIPPHRVYIEPFVGGGAVALHKRLAVATIAVDSDAAALAGFTQSFRSMLAENGDAGHPGAPIAKNDDASWSPGLTVINGDAISFLESYTWQGGEFVYCDPPYLFETRAGGRRKIYKSEFGDIYDHDRLLGVLLTLPCMVATSGYWSGLYAKALDNWREIHYQTRTRGGQTVTEWLWMNYPEPSELQDYRYLGENFRERERLSRIRRRWLARLDRMDRLERYMLASAIAENSERIRTIPTN